MLDELRSKTFLEKYALRDKDGRLLETEPQQMWARIAREIASVEKKPEEWEDKFYSLLDDFRFLPGGRIMFGAGNPLKSTLLNCYVLPVNDDSLEAIFNWCKEAARTYSFGGGVGTDISILRPKGSPVNNSARFSTGAVSFMELLSQTTATIGQYGRRGALMITIDVSHPDILDFINVKSDKERRNVRYANISVKLSDDFMRAVVNDGDFTLRFKNVDRVVKARTIWKNLVESAWKSAEPGVMFWDTIVSESPTEYNHMNVMTTNPCGEQPLDPYNNCCLGSINLSKFVRNPFNQELAEIDYVELENAVELGVRFLDNVVTYSANKHPLKKQKATSLRSRRIGLGVTGFGDMLAMLCIKYDSDRAISKADELFERIKNVAYISSAKLASERGSFSMYHEQSHLARPFIKRLSHEAIEHIKACGLRNACILTIPPVGTGSVLAGCSSGIEPIFATSYTRRSESLSKGEYRVEHPLVKTYFSMHEDAFTLPSYFVTAHQIDPIMRVKMQAAIQRHIDSAISSTVNLPENATPDDVESIYMMAWKNGCKSITVYREGSREGILLTDKFVSPADRPKVLKGSTHCISTEEGKLYVTINKVGESPFEVFVQLGKSGQTSLANAEAIGRMISLALRAGISVDEIVGQLRDIGGSKPVFDDGRIVLSVPDAIAKLLSDEFKPKVDKKEFEKCVDCSE